MAQDRHNAYEAGSLGAHLTPTAGQLKVLRAVARGETPADLTIRNCRVLSLHSGEILPRDVHVVEGFIAAVAPHGTLADGKVETIDAGQRYLAPNFIDTHIHIEYSLLTPAEFARCVVPRGTGCVLADPNCIGNVLGASAMDWVGQTEAPLKIMQQISSRIPRNPRMELGGAVVTEAEQCERIPRRSAVSLGEAGPYGFDDQAARLNELTLSNGRRITGHSARVSGQDLWGFAATGVGDDHNAFNPEEVLERIRLGMMITVMAGSMNDNVPLVFSNIDQLRDSLRHFSFCADDRHVDDLHRIGHIDHHVRESIQQGIPILEAYRMSSLNAAAFYHLDHVLGSITPSRRADFMLLDDLEAVRPCCVFSDGVKVAQDGKALFAANDPIPPTFRSTMNLAPGFGPSSFKVPSTAKPDEVAVVRAMEMYDGYFKRAFEAELTVSEGNVLADPASDVAKIAVVDRHQGTDSLACGFVRGFDLNAGALAGTTNCENQNLVVVGTNDNDMSAACEALRQLGGGYVAVKNGEVLASLPLPIAGIMSDLPFEEVLSGSDQVNAAAQALGCKLSSPFMILAFVGLAGVPDYGLTEKGFIDTPTQSFIPVVIGSRCHLQREDVSEASLNVQSH